MPMTGHPSPTNLLQRVYVEVTNRCNLDCTTCMRNVWGASFGRMRAETYARLLSALEDFSPRAEIFFGGYGEPLAHSDIVQMIREAKVRGHRVSLITNATLLDEDRSLALIEAGLDTLWVSLDGLTPQSYADIRLGAALPEVLTNLERLQALRRARFGDSPWAGNPLLGIAFVAMKRNIHELPQLLELGERLGAVTYSITNVLAHTPELNRETLYSEQLGRGAEKKTSDARPQVNLPRMDINAQTAESHLQLLSGKFRLSLADREVPTGGDMCPFLERGALAVRWDGKVSPCLPLMYTHTYYLGERLHTSYEYHVGDLNEHSLADIWNAADYVALRHRLQTFNFSPCVSCNSCELANDNREDCSGNVHPACGTCLWAQGFIRCP